jgi:hypothetical protein
MHKRKPCLHGERRSQVRYPHQGEVSCRLLGTSEEASWPAAFGDLSCGGATLLMGREVSPGAVLEVALGGQGGRSARALLMRVRHVRQGEGATWQAGCSFVRPLTAHDLEVLLLETGAADSAPKRR